MNKQTILVTGSSRGIGKSIALLAASRGYHVFLNCRQSLQELEAVRRKIVTSYSGSCELVPGDVGNADDIRTMFETINAAGSGLDVLVNNAGISHIGLLSDLSDEKWEQVIRTNLSSVFYCSRAAIPHMVAKKSGRIINISSMWGTSGASCEAAYSASKSGVHGLTKALAKELAPSNIQVNAIACGVIDTVMNGQLSKEERTALTEEIPAGRFGMAEEVAEMVWHLMSAPTYLTGQIIGIDGGFI